MKQSRLALVVRVVLLLASVVAAPAEAQYRFVQLGTLAPPASYPTAINNRNQVVGYSNVPGDSSLFHGFLWEKGRLTDLGTWPGGFFSEARDINERGQIVGNALDEMFRGHAVIWEDGRMRELASPHARGVVVGGGSTGNPGQVGNLPFLWTDGAMHVLPNPPGHVGAQAVVINDRGVIAGVAVLPEGDTHAVLWIPDPSGSGGKTND